jgi:hypothetical protein
MCKVAREVVGVNVSWTRSTILLNKAHYGS